MTPLRIWIDAGRIPSGSTTRRLPIMRFTSGMKKLFQQILRHAQAIRCRGTEIIDGGYLGGKRRQRIAAFWNSGFGFPTSQWHRRDTAESNPNLTRRLALDTGEAHLGNGLRAPCSHLAVVVRE